MRRRSRPADRFWAGQGLAALLSPLADVSEYSHGTHRQGVPISVRGDARVEGLADRQQQFVAPVRFLDEHGSVVQDEVSVSAAGTVSAGEENTRVGSRGLNVIEHPPPAKFGHYHVQQHQIDSVVGFDYV